MKPLSFIWTTFFQLYVYHLKKDCLRFFRIEITIAIISTNYIIRFYYYIDSSKYAIFISISTQKGLYLTSKMCISDELFVHSRRNTHLRWQKKGDSKYNDETVLVFIEKDLVFYCCRSSKAKVSNYKRVGKDVLSGTKQTLQP